MNKSKIFAVSVALLAVIAVGGAVAQSLTARAWTYVEYTVIAANSNAVPTVISTLGNPRVKSITLTNASAIALKYSFGSVPSSTNITLILGRILQAGGSVTYTEVIPLGALCSKSTSNGTTATLGVELLTD